MGAMTNAGGLTVHIMNLEEARDIFLGHDPERTSNPLLGVLEVLIFPTFLDQRWFLLVADLEEAVLYVLSSSGPEPGPQIHTV